MRSKWNPERIEMFINEMEEEVPRWKTVAWVTVFVVTLFLLFWFGFDKTAPIALASAFVLGARLGSHGAKKEFVAKLEKDCTDIG